MIAFRAGISSPGGDGDGAVLVARPGITQGPEPQPDPAHASGGAVGGHPPDATTIADWLRRFFVVPGQAVELRAIYKSGSTDAARRTPQVGFFDDQHLDVLAEQGLRLSQEDGVKGVYFTLNPLKPELLTRPGLANRVRPARQGDSASAADVVRRCWLFIDADPRRPAGMKGCSATDAEKARARAKVLQVRDFLTGLGWPLPLVADSGNGYHLLYRVDLPVDDGGLVRRVLRALAGRFDDCAVEIDTTVHDAPRITRLYGSKACKGDPSDERPHRWTGLVDVPEPLETVGRELLEGLAGEAPTDNRRADGVSIQIPVLPVASKQALARAYVAKMPGAVEGHGGDRQTFQVACRLVIDFDLTPEQALPLLQEYNARCTPPWPDDALVHKLERALQAANEKPGERGRLLHASREGATHAGTTRPPSADPSVSARPPFLGTVPDFIQADWLKVQPCPPVRDGKEAPPRGRPAIALVGLRWLLHREVIRQKRATVWLPDVVLAQVIWGGRPSPGQLAATDHLVAAEVLPVAEYPQPLREARAARMSRL
jgi:hypothetical protein